MISQLVLKRMFAGVANIGKTIQINLYKASEDLRENKDDPIFILEVADALEAFGDEAKENLNIQSEVNKGIWKKQIKK